MGNSEGSVKDEEELSVQIYEAVHKLYPENSEKITGMLLESDHEELSVLLNGNHEELQKRIKLAADVVQENKPDVSNERVTTEDEESIGNKIYGTVHQLYPTYAGNITGMLLEMDKEQLVCLINDKDILLRCIHQAAHVYMESQTEKKQLSGDREQNINLLVPKTHNNHDIQSLDEGQEKELLGEQLYLKIERKHPNEAAKVTGMLLEMDAQNLKQVLDDSALLDKTIQEALEVLHNVENGKNGIFSNLSEQEAKYNSISHNDTNKTRKSSMDHERDELVEQLYHKIVARHPTKAYKITGMFLEMDTNFLKQLNANSELFDRQVTECLKAME
ncbi:uncharacterized protein LOC110253855 isoform X2 [Exaiptasia diaphana]|uniref:PABC domain-containing protein n=1 Tax=Exaiptasia diaphana TaxID=2652724 RepID=A0A913YV76_EXADI|nr:uncharacterized protein LOC110253855 isoform X2 [Exaiptasia diaphana]